MRLLQLILYYYYNLRKNGKLAFRRILRWAPWLNNPLLSTSSKTPSSWKSVFCDPLPMTSYGIKQSSPREWEGVNLPKGDWGRGPIIKRMGLFLKKTRRSIWIYVGIIIVKCPGILQSSTLKGWYLLEQSRNKLYQMPGAFTVFNPEGLIDIC